MIISERIFKLIEEKNITQMEFGKRTGISNSTISDWKRKKTNPSADKIMDICYALDVTPEQLLTGDGIDDADEIDIPLDRFHIDKSDKKLSHLPTLCQPPIIYQELSSSHKSM